MDFDDSGIDLSQWQETLANGEKTDLIEFFEKAKALNLRNSMFVDITANAAVAGTYEYYLKQSIAVIACNKIACSSNYEQYQNLKNLSRKYKAPFLFETNVGAGLPVIDTLNHLIASGDRIRSIHAVLSGSLNFIFNNFNESTTFYEVVKQAQKEGYTEPDPRIDLSGKDVARKLLILARESGYKLGMSDILNDGFLPEGALESSSVDDFYTLIKSKDEEFKTLLNSANNNDAKLKYVASFIDGKANVGLQEVQAGHPFYNLEGKDNIVMFYTDRYTDQPLIIKGAGAGSEVTASGLFADIIRASNI
jgi:aspartokinase/homoserine dehydrogenase 1